MVEAIFLGTGGLKGDDVRRLQEEKEEEKKREGRSLAKRKEKREGFCSVEELNIGEEKRGFWE